MTAQNPQELAAFLESLEDYVPTVALYNMQLLLRPREGVSEVIVTSFLFRKRPMIECDHHKCADPG